MQPSTFYELLTRLSIKELEELTSESDTTGVH